MRRDNDVTQVARLARLYRHHVSGRVDDADYEALRVQILSDRWIARHAAKLVAVVAFGAITFTWLVW